MTYKISCPVCKNQKKLYSFKWNNFSVTHCGYCNLDFCEKMIEKEVGGDSSPVPKDGIEMMSNSFFKTNKLAMNFVRKRKMVYDELLFRNCSKVLDIGCGPGVFYKPWNQLNIKWEGIDINPYWSKFGKKNKIPISNQSIESIVDKFDVITAHQVIEHVQDPIAFMKSIKELLNPGGIIHLELPNQNSLTAKLRKISSKISFDYGFIQPPMHLRAYRKETIQFLFNRLNLKSKMVFVCGNTDKIWGQAREYSITQKIVYSLTGKTGLGSLLIGIAKSN